MAARDAEVWHSSFEDLMRQLGDQHAREVMALRAELHGLREFAVAAGVVLHPTVVGDKPPVAEFLEATIPCDEKAPAAAPPTPRETAAVAPAAVAAEPPQAQSPARDAPSAPELSEDCPVPPSPVMAAPPSPEEATHVVVSSSASMRRPTFRKIHRHTNEPGNASWKLAVREWVEEHLDMYVGVVIILNVIFVYVELERTGDEAGIAIGAKPPGNSWPNLDVCFAVIANMFACVFSLELLGKLYFLRGDFFYANRHLQKFNIFDGIIVMASVIDLWIISPFFSNTTSGPSLQVIRLFRFIRMMRTLRIVRTFEVFSKLRVLVTTVVTSFFALFWSLVLLGVVMLMAALVMCQSVNLIFLDDSVDADFKVRFFRYFGTPTRSLWTIFEITFGGGWQQHARPLVEEVSGWWALFFVVYCAGVIFAMFKIITALFLKDTMSIASQDAEAVIQDKMKEKARNADKLLAVFTAADSSGDGFVTWDEFEEMLEDETACAYLATMELDEASTKFLFSLLDDGDGRVSVQEFVNGALRLKGQARSSDVVSIMHDTSKVLQKLSQMESSLERLLRLETSLEDLKGQGWSV